MTYIKECLQILYWSFFKPFTFQRWLKDIHPDLKMDSNPFAMKDQWEEYPGLGDYADQIWWLCAIVPLLSALSAGAIWTIFAAKPFIWWMSLGFLAGWLTGLLLARGRGEWFKKWGMRFLILSLTVNMLKRFSPETLGFLSELSPDSLQFILSELKNWWIFYVVAAGVVSGVLGVTEGVAVGVAGSVMAVGVAGSVVAVGVAGSVVAVAVAVGVAVGVAGSVAEGVAGSVLIVGVTGSVAGSVACILGILRVYFWLFEFPAMLIYYGWISMSESKALVQNRCMKILPYLPFYYDELIRLPLPFVADIIAEAYQANQTAARQAVNYLITSTNQQKTAARAIQLISEKSLLNAKSTQDISEMPLALSWITSDYKNPLLSEFMNISQEVISANNASSYFRKSEMMARPIEMLENLRTRLSREDAETATAFGAVIENWLSILHTARKTLREEARKEGEIPQEYIAGPSLKPEESKDRFKGRNDVFREIEMLVLSAQRPTLLLYGQRRTGKTSLLRYMPRKLGTQIVPVLIDMQKSLQSVTLSGVAESMVNQIKEELRCEELPDPNAEALKNDPFVAIDKWFDDIEKVVKDRTILLCLDEFERLQEIVEETKSRAPLNFLRSITQNRKRWGLLFSGSHFVDELAAYWSDYLIGTRTVKLDYLKEDEASELIRKPVQDFPDIYEDETVKTVFHLTQGQPMLTQLICYEIVERLNRQKRQRASPEDAEAVIPKAFEAAGQYFIEFWMNLSDTERNALIILANKDLQGEADAEALKRLVRRGVIVRNNDAHIIRVPLIQRWIAENRF